MRYQRRMLRDWEAYIRRNPPLSEAPQPVEPPPLGRPPPRGEPVDAIDLAGVHEPGIVKATRGHLLALVGGRLNAVRIGGGALAPAGSVEAGGRSILAAGDMVMGIGGGWDEMDVELWRLGEAGEITPTGTYQLRANRRTVREGGSSFRLVDGKLVVYTPIGFWARDTAAIPLLLPAVRRTHPAGDTTWRPLAAPADIFRPSGRMRADDETTFHVVTVCDPAGGELDCRATVVYAPEPVAHHVSRTAVYVHAFQRPDSSTANPHDRFAIYRIPLDGGVPTALGITGLPENARSFAETADGRLDVLLRATLLRVPLASFGDGSLTAPPGAYTALPVAGPGTFHNRFVGDWVLYGVDSGLNHRGTLEKGRVFAARRDGATNPVPLPLPPGQYDGLLGIEAMGAGALVTGESPDSLHYYPVRLGDTAAASEPFARPGRWTGDIDAHAVFYHPEDEDRGIVGVALSNYGATASVLFLRNEGFRLSQAGELAATVPPGTECPSCGHYAYALPIFVQGRIFALVGPELVEGVMENGRIRELRRIRLETAPAQ